MDTGSSNFGDRLLLAIQVCGMTQTEFAKKSGIDRFHINHFVRSRRAPDFYSLRDILESLPSIDARWLITGAGIMTNARTRK